MSETKGYCQIGAGGLSQPPALRPMYYPETDFVAVRVAFSGKPLYWGAMRWPRRAGWTVRALVQIELAVCDIDAPPGCGYARGSPRRGCLSAGVRLATCYFGRDMSGYWPRRHVCFTANATHMAVVEESLGPALKRIERTRG